MPSRIYGNDPITLGKMRYLMHEIAAVLAIAMKENHGPALTLVDVVELYIHSLFRLLRFPKREWRYVCLYTAAAFKTYEPGVLQAAAKIQNATLHSRRESLHKFFPFFIREFLNRIPQHGARHSLISC